MEKCFNCGVLETKAILVDVILPEGIMKICGKCFSEENLPVIKNGFSFQKEKKQTVYEMLLRISGVDLSKRESDEKRKQEASLRNTVDFNFEKNFRNDSDSKKYLINNFHWVIMRARRSKKLTQEQFAEEIHEPVKVIELMEKGFVPEKKEIINKIEDCLGIRIKKNNEEEVEKKELADFDFKNVKNLTISDLQEMKKKKDEGVLRE